MASGFDWKPYIIMGKSMNGYLFGEVCALGAALSNAIACTCFNKAEEKISAFTVNLLKTIVALVSIILLRVMLYGTFDLKGIGLEGWIYLGLSGLIGFVFGDFFYFASFLYLPYRISMLIFNCNVIVTALAAWVLYDQKLQLLGWVGIILVFIGLGVILFKNNYENAEKHKDKMLAKGICYAVLGMLGQAGGVLLSEKGLSFVDVAGSTMAASQIRIIVGVIGLFFITFIGKNTKTVRRDLKLKKPVLFVAIGGICGCAIGTTLTLQSLEYIQAGVSAAITSISPILILPVTVLIQKEKIHITEIIGTITCIAGVIILSV